MRNPPAPGGASPLEEVALWELCESVLAPEPAAAAWVEKFAARTRRREQAALRISAKLVAERIRHTLPPQDWYRLELTDAATDTDRLSGRMVVATLNEDTATCDALVRVWCSWPTEARRAVLAGLVRRVF